LEESDDEIALKACAIFRGWGRADRSRALASLIHARDRYRKINLQNERLWNGRLWREADGGQNADDS
jgi:hypothetical protein